RDFKELIPTLEKKLKKRGVPGVFLDLEPHVKGGGQFGGFSGPDGMGVALRACCRVLDYIDIGYHLRDFDDVRVARGFYRGAGIRVCRKPDCWQTRMSALPYCPLQLSPPASVQNAELRRESAVVVFE